MDSLHQIERPRTRRRFKTKSEKTVKERNTQRQRRKEGLFHKAYEMAEFCDYWVAVTLYNPNLGEYYMFKSVDSPTWPPSFEQIMESDKTPQLRLPDYYEQRNIRREVSSGEDDKGSATSSATHADTSPPSASPTLREPLLAPRDESANNTGEAAQELYLPFVAPASHSLFSLFRRWI